jgi:hypothetical protein
MKITYPLDGPFAVIELADETESSLIRYALDAVASGRVTTSAADNRRRARTAYEGLTNGPTEDGEWRAAACTGGQWCRCPVTTPCPARGTSTVTGRHGELIDVSVPGDAHPAPDVP